MSARRSETAWMDTPDGQRKYREARERAQLNANDDGFDRGIEANHIFKSFSVFMLPRKENRRGFELRCEVVSCEILAKCQEGHGPVSALKPAPEATTVRP